MGRTLRFAVVGAVAAAAFALGRGVGAEEPAGGPPAPKKIEHPFLKDLVGTWAFQGDMPGTTVVRMALGDTAIVEDLESDMQGTPYHGHGVRKVSDDGKTMKFWWFDSFSPEPEVFEGPLAADGYEVKSPQHRITMKRVEGGFEFKMFEGEQQLFASQYTRKK